MTWTKTDWRTLLEIVISDLPIDGPILPRKCLEGWTSPWSSAVLSPFMDRLISATTLRWPQKEARNKVDLLKLPVSLGLCWNDVRREVMLLLLQQAGVENETFHFPQSQKTGGISSNSLTANNVVFLVRIVMSQSLKDCSAPPIAPLQIETFCS